MSELKCPACKTALSNPLPACCPVCNLEGLNRMFLTLEDYEDWKKNVLDEHIKKLRNHKIFVGEAHVLVLMDDGTLFQIEGNKPAKVAENVKSVAAGYNYSMYLDSAGKVHFLGNSGIPFKERFYQGKRIFKRVFARNDIDIFGAEDIDENLYVWGDNHSKQLETKSETFLKELDIIKCRQIKGHIQIKYGVSMPYYGTIRNYGFDFEDSEKCYEFINVIRNSSDYEILKNIYSEDNLMIKFNLSKQNVDNLTLTIDDLYKSKDDFLVRAINKKINGKIYYLGKDREGTCVVETSMLESQVFLVNNYIFEPQQSKGAFNRLFDKFLKKYEGLRKLIVIYKDKVEVYARLENDCSLNIFRIEHDRKLTKITTFKDIMDFSEAGNGFIYLIDYSNKIWRMILEDILKLSQEVAPEELLQFVCEF